MNEFDPQPAVGAAVTPQVPPAAPPKKESLLTRKLWLGQSLPWLAGGALIIIAAGWYLFMPAFSVPDTDQLAFGQESGFSTVQPSAAVTSPVPATAPLQTGGLSVPDAALNGASGASSVPEDVVNLIREGREFEAANREAITRLANTVRAQTQMLASMQQKLDGVAQENGRLANQLTMLAARPTPPSSGHATGGKIVKRSALAGMRLESLQNGMAWISWQGRTWAVQPGDSLGSVTVRDVNAAERSVLTSAGVLR